MLLLTIGNNENGLGVMYTYPTSVYPTGPVPFDARIKSCKNHKIELSVNLAKTKNRLI